MRLFHVSEESDIKVFKPRIPTRSDLEQSIGLVWAINEECLPNFLTPRDCPRVTYHVGKGTTSMDRDRFVTSKNCNHVVIIENRWLKIMNNTTLYLYEFDPVGFKLQDEIAGYYVSATPQVPIGKIVIKDLLQELFLRNVEVRLVDNLWDICDKIKNTSFHWSMCRMANAIRN
jgi:hypothetical protein